MNFNNFYECWQWLYQHPAFWIVDRNGRIPFSDGFGNVLDVEVVKINPKTKKIEDNDEHNTETRIWLEVGTYFWEDETGCYTISHDADLDCGGRTFEKAIMNLANLVKEKYGDYSQDYMDLPFEARLPELNHK